MERQYPAGRAPCAGGGPFVTFNWAVRMFVTARVRALLGTFRTTPGAWV